MVVKNPDTGAMLRYGRAAHVKEESRLQTVLERKPGGK